jgi:hypothetical protein
MIKNIFVVLIFSFSISFAQDIKEQNDANNISLDKPISIFERAAGFMDAGKMKVHGVYNYGLLSGFDPPGYQTWYPGAYHGSWGEVRWIVPIISMPPGPWGNQSTGGQSLPDDRSNQYNTMESFSCIHLLQGDGVNFSDWEALDNSSKYLHGSLLQDNLPMVATSTFPTSWPEGYFDDNGNWILTPGENHWPGKWALDPDESSPTYGQEIPGNFVSNKDIFFISSDKYNGIRSGATTARYGYPVGIDMEVSGYSYSTPIYTNVTFFNINYIFRTEEELSNPQSKFYDPTRHHYSGKIDSVYFAFFVDPDLPGRYLVPGSNYYQAVPWAEDDYGLTYDYDGDGTIDVFLAFDKVDQFTDQNYSQNTGPVSAYGINFFKTPKENPGNPNSNEIGITGFHWFDQDEAMRPLPVNENLEKVFYAISAGKPELLSENDRNKWFHGADPNFDDIELLKDYQESFPVGSRPDIQFWFSSGPFSISPGDTIPIHIGIVGGVPNPGTLDAEGFPTNPPNVRFNTVFDALVQANELYKNNFIGFRPPAAPKLSAVGTEVIDKEGLPVVYGENGKVTLYWDSNSEDSYEIVTREKDFQGYRIYKTQAALYGQGDPQWGTPIYDYSGEEIIGYKPLAIYDLIDSVSGPDPLNPFFDLGSNSGLKYSFTDNDVLNGVRYRYTITAYDHPILEAGQPSLESFRGNDPRLIQTIDVIPGVTPQGYQPGRVDSNIIHNQGIATGNILLKNINPIEITGDTYRLDFKESQNSILFDVFNETKNKYVLTDFSKIWLEEESGIVQPRPIFDGVGLTVINHNKLEELSRRWTNIVDDTSNYKFSKLTTFSDTSGIPCDYAVVFWDSSLKYYLQPNGAKVPFKIYNITKDPNLQNPLNLFVRNPGTPWATGDFVYLLEPDVQHRTWQFTINWQAGDLSPSDGDIYFYQTKKPFTSNDKYSFTTSSLYTESTGYDFSKIKVVPNPYVGYNITEQGVPEGERYVRELRFTHLPPECTIKIYTLRGDLVKSIQHNSTSIGEERWNLQNEEQMEVAYGVYLYTVESKDGTHKVDKFAIIK